MSYDFRAEWESYASVSAAKVAPPLVREYLRWAFYAGALSLYAGLIDNEGEIDELLLSVTREFGAHIAAIKSSMRPDA